MVFWFYFLFFIFGLGIGSFLNVLTIRFKPKDDFSILESIKGRSHCPSCGKKLKWFELIPILSFIIQKGKCRNCGASLSWQYPIVEFLSGSIFFLISWHWVEVFGFYNFYKVLFFSLLWGFYFSVFLALAIIDLKYFLVPQSLLDTIFYPALFINIFFTFGILKPIGSFIGLYANFFPKTNIYFLDSLIGILIIVGILWVLVKATKEKAIGMGDVKIFFILSLIFPWPTILIIFFLSFLIGGVFSIISMAFKKYNMKTKVPFFPFIFLAVLIIFLFGGALLNFYFALC